MNQDIQEQACWLLLVFESGLSTRVVNDILSVWCKQLQRSLRDFFATSAEEWSATCQLRPEAMQKLEQAKEKLAAQKSLVEQLQQEGVQVITVLDPTYPPLLQSASGRTRIPPILFCKGDLEMLKRQTIAIIGARNANELSLAFSREAARYCAANGANVISGNARGVDRAAYEGATSTDGCTTVILPHGLRKLSKVQLRDLQPRIESGNVLLISQFHPAAPWVVSRAMERNHVVTGLAQVVIVAEADSKGGTWEGARGALKQGQCLYVRQADAETLPGNKLLLENGARSLPWPSEDFAAVLLPVLQEGARVREKQQALSAPPDQLSLLMKID